MNTNIYKHFKDVIVAGACFFDSAFFKVWNKMGVKFAIGPKLSKKIRYDKHPNGSELKVYYSIKEGHNWTKRLMSDKDERGNTAKDADGNNINEGHNFKLIEKAVLNLFEDDFAYSVNNGYDAFEGIERATELPQSLFGINEFKEHVNIACLSARNLNVNFMNFLKSFADLNREEVRNCIGRQFTYQSALRGALREPDDHRPKSVYIPDGGTARWFADMFEGCEVIYLPVEGLELPKREGRPRISKTEAERKARNAARMATKRKENSLFGEFTNVPTTTDFMGSLFKSIRSKKWLAVNKTPSEFEQLLEDWSQASYASKSDNRLICPSFFQLIDGIDKERGKPNVVFANGIWLDFDGVKDKTTKELIKRSIDPDKLPQYWPFRMTTFNSYGSSGTWMEYRVYIPTDRTVSIGRVF